MRVSATVINKIADLSTKSGVSGVFMLLRIT